MMICNNATCERLIETHPLFSHVWLKLVMPNFFTETVSDMKIAVLYFHTERAPGSRNLYPVQKFELENAHPSTIQGVMKKFVYSIRNRLFNGVATSQTKEAFRAVRDEYQRLHDEKVKAQDSWNIRINRRGVLDCYLTPFQEISGTIDRDIVEELQKLQGRSVMELVIMRDTREVLSRAVNGDVWRVHPHVPLAVAAAIKSYESQRSPLIPLSPIQSLGYIDEKERIECKRDFLDFKKGEFYPVTTETVPILIKETRAKPTYMRLDRDDTEEAVECRGQDLLVRIGSGIHSKREKWTGFSQYPLADQSDCEELLRLPDILENFHIPDVQDVASLDPDSYKEMIAKIEYLEAGKLKFKQFQKEDLARSAMKNGAIIAWEQGLGKSFAAFAWPIIKGARRVLIVAPEGLHRQLRQTGWEFFNQHPPTISNEQDIRTYGLHKPPVGDEIEFFLISYQQLGMNGADEWLPNMTKEGELLIPKDLKNSRRKLLGRAKYDHSYFAGTGEIRNGITCLVKPCFARVFNELETFDCVVVDEGTKLQATNSCISQGVRMLDPDYRLLLTGTPIKNRLETLFWLAWWAAGGKSEPHARWPFKATSEAREDFANAFLIRDRFVTREEEDQHKARAENRRPRKFEKRTARICNIHRLWKLISPIILRRRKVDCGEEIQPKIMHHITVPFGHAQRLVYAHHLDNPPAAPNRRVQIAMQLDLLRQAALCPESIGVNNKNADPKRSWTNFTPKLSATIELIQKHLDRGEQVMVGSPFRAFSNELHNLLTAAGVSSILLDGTKSPATRAKQAEDFKQFKHSVLVAGIKAMGEGYDFPQCPNLILPSLSWAFDENDQFIQRVWRMTSPAPVNIYAITTEHSIDMRVSELFKEKGDSAALALDGRLFDEDHKEVDLEELLAETIKALKTGSADVTQEQTLLDGYDQSTKQRLGISEQRFREWHPPIIPGHGTTKETIAKAEEMISKKPFNREAFERAAKLAKAFGLPIPSQQD